jgi:LacI family transcriptional regulator
MGVATSSVDHVTVDNVRIGHLGLEYLSQQKCDEVAFVSLAPEWTSVRLRAQAFMTAAHDRKVPATAYLLCSDPWPAEPYGGRVVTAATPEDLVAKMASAKPPPNGLFIGTDAWTAQLYPILHSHGLKPMRNVQIVSCDNETMRLSSLFPRPATIDPGSEQIGYRAVVRLVARLRQSTELPFMILTCPQLIPPPSPSSPGKSW